MIQPVQSRPSVRRSDLPGEPARAETQTAARPAAAQDRFTHARAGSALSEPIPVRGGNAPTAPAAAPARARTQGPGDAKANYNALVSAPEFARLSPEIQRKVTEVYLRVPTSPEQTESLIRLMKSKFQGLDDTSKAQLLDVLANTTVGGQRSVVALMGRSLASGQSALLDRDKDGGTLLQSLHKIATGRLDPELKKNEVHVEGLLAGVLQEVASPGEVNQDRAWDTCTVTSMQFQLCRQNPAEFARLVQGLLAPGGRVGLRDGGTLARVPNSILRDRGVERSASERIFQAAMMEYCNGSRVTYDNAGDKHSDGMDGLAGSQPYVGIRALFGKGSVEQLSIGQADLKQVELGQVPPKQTEILGKIRASAQNPRGVYADLFWDRDKKGGHAVVVTAVKADETGQERVYFHNPLGAVADGTRFAYDPPRRIENGADGSQSMLAKDFEGWVISAGLPR